MAGKGKTTNAGKKLKDINKFVEDKTFGMKNKNKSKQVQNMVKGIASQNKGGMEKLEAEIYEEKKRKQQIEENKKLMGDVFAKNVAKKGNSNICQFFKAGLCNKGRKCKFSHDIDTTNTNFVTEEKKEVEDSRTMKIDLFVDQRELIFGHHRQDKDHIDNWNTKDLKEVVDFNAHKYLNANKTDKLCKNFLEAVETKKYGWNWLCPNGHDCIFKHCLPQGYVLESEKKKLLEKKEDPNIYLYEIDNNRDKLDKEKLNAVTKEQFMKWKNIRMEKLLKARVDRTKEELQKLGIKKKKIVTGVEFFKLNEGNIQDAEDGAIEEFKREEINIDEDAFNEDEDLPDDLD